MKLPRPGFLHLVAGAAILPILSALALAQTYPSRPVRWVVGFTPGGATDVIARLMGQSLSERLGQSFVIENRPGAGSNIATEAVVNAPADGYTLLLVVPAHAVNATLYEKLNYNFIRDIAPVASFTREPNVMVVNPALPAESVPEFIVYANANPGRINMASSGDQCDSRRPQREGATRGTRRHGAPWLARRLRQLIAEETEKWGKVIRTANIKPE